MMYPLWLLLTAFKAYQLYQLLDTVDKVDGLSIIRIPKRKPIIEQMDSLK